MELFILILAVLISPVSAFWRLPCSNPLVVQRADPIVNPGQVSKHVHTIMGSSGFNFRMTYEQARAGTCTTCKVVGDMSNYWVPTLYYRARNGTFTSVRQVGGMLVYYLQRKDKGEQLLAYPPGFRMVAGDASRRNYTGSLEQQAISWTCLDDKNGGETPHMPDHNCRYGLRQQVFFPSCWDGQRLDSHDHKSHMSYPSVYNAGRCPPGFPKRFVSIFYEIVWSVDDFKNDWYGKGHPFVLSNGDPTGFGGHGDFVNGWDQQLLQRAVNECNNDSGRIEDCHVFKLHRDEETSQCRQPPSVDETVFGNIPHLPGCTPVNAHGGLVSSPAQCRAVNTISGPKRYFTDMTRSGWQYLGCGTDDPGARSMPMRTTSDTMTPAECIRTCSAAGYKLAGLEYANECYCGHSIPANRAPKTGVLGGCDMACKGDNGQYCGGSRALALYQWCSSGNCRNNLFRESSTKGVSTFVVSAKPPLSRAVQTPARQHRSHFRRRRGRGGPGRRGGRRTTTLQPGRRRPRPPPPPDNGNVQFSGFWG